MFGQAKGAYYRGKSRVRKGIKSYIKKRDKKRIQNGYWDYH